MLRRILSIIALIALASPFMLHQGCGRADGLAVSEQDEPSYRRGQSLLRENRLNEAMLAFSNVVEARRDSPESHLELGRIYLDHVKDPVAAIYHFRKYLELRPDSDRAKQVAQLVDTARKDFARSLPGNPMGEQIDRLDLMDQLARLRNENEQLRTSVARLKSDLDKARRPGAPAQSSASYTQAAQQQAPASFVPKPVQPISAASSQERTYTVVAGDTLSGISQKVYGTTARWREIFEANKHQLKSANDLKLGMELKIPAAPVSQ